MSKILFQIFALILFYSTSSLSLASEQGIAAYYSDVFQGRKTASGRIYNKNELTAAHKSLAFGTVVKVTDLKNNQSVLVTITDRGPRSRTRIIDLSYAAAQQIGLIKAGISQVTLEVIE